MADAAFLNMAVDLIHAELTKFQRVDVLEAGCGSASHVTLDFNKRMVGIDIDLSQLENNHNLDEIIHGDLQSYVLPREGFDLVVCCDVLEHLQRPEDALVNMANTLRKDGYLLIACPEPYSYKGFLAKYSPHWMRKIIFRVLTGKSHRTMLTDSVIKTFFPTYLEPFCSRNQLTTWALGNGYEIIFNCAYDAHTHGLHRIFRPMAYLMVIFNKLVIYVTKGNVDLLRGDYCCLFKKAHK